MRPQVSTSEFLSTKGAQRQPLNQTDAKIESKAQEVMKETQVDSFRSMLPDQVIRFQEEWGRNCDTPEQANLSEQGFDQDEEIGEKSVSQPAFPQATPPPHAAPAPSSRASANVIPVQSMTPPTFEGIEDISGFYDFEENQIRMWRTLSETCALDRPFVGDPEIPNRALLDAEFQARQVLAPNQSVATEVFQQVNQRLDSIETRRDRIEKAICAVEEATIKLNSELKTSREVTLLALIEDIGLIDDVIEEMLRHTNNLIGEVKKN